MTATGQRTIDASFVARPAPERSPDGWPGLERAAERDGIALDSRTVDRLLEYRDLLLAWNQRFNLTAIAEPAAVDRVLLLDAVRMLPALDAAVAATGLRHPSLVDIGSGGGLPAIPLALCRTDLDVTMVEATGKKTDFLQEAIDRLGIGNARALHGRAEEIARDPAHRGRYDIATARAVSSLPALVELCLPLLRDGGIALFPKGLAIDAELGAANAACREVGGEIVADTLLAGGETRLIAVRKTRPTPDRFPRRAGIPAKEPLGSYGGGRRP